MTATSPQVALARAYRGLQRADIPIVAAKAGVMPKQVGNLISGRPISTDAFLRLAIAIGHDPMPDLPPPPGERTPADLDRLRFALALRIKRGLNGHDERAAGRAMHLSGATVCRVENAHIMSSRVVITVARYLDSHVFGWLRNDDFIVSKPDPVAVPVPRETIAQHIDIACLSCFHTQTLRPTRC